MLQRALKTLLIFSILAATDSAFAVELETTNQKYSYTMGVKIGQMLRGQVSGELDIEAFSAAVAESLNGQKPRLSPKEMQLVMQQNFKEQEAKRAKLAEQNEEKGKTFLAANALKQGVTTLDNGMQYKVTKAGTGASPTAEQKVEVHYRGRLIDGTEFDSSYSRGKPAQFNLNGVIPGFREAITRMKPGAQWVVYVPADLAYGKKGAGNSIGPNETLIFEIEYLRAID